MLHKIIIVLLVLSFNVVAQANEVLVINNVKISATDKNATLARNVAIEKGQLKAFSELVRLYFPTAAAKAAGLTESQIFNTVEGFELSGEKRSATNYFAKMTVKFNSADVEKLMGKYSKNTNERAITPEVFLAEEVPAIGVAAPAMDSLIVPVFEKDGKIYWFDDDNIWLNFWHKKLQNSTSNQFVLPIGDLEDLALLNKDVLAKNIIDLSSLFERYNINNIALLKLKIVEDTSVKAVTLQIDYINRFHHAWQQYSFQELPGDNLQMLMPEYYAEVMKFKFNANQSFADSLETSDSKTIMVEFPLAKLTDWVDLEQSLKHIKYITNIELKTVSLQSYSFALTYNIELAKLQNILAKYNLTLENNGENHYTIIKEVLDAKY